MLNKDKIRRKITQKIMDPTKGYSIAVDILRQGKGVFKQKREDLIVCRLNGYFHTSSRCLNVNFGDSGQVPQGFYEKLMVVYDDHSVKVKVNDYFKYNGVTYKIVDKNPNLDIYFDFDLARIDNGIDNE